MSVRTRGQRCAALLVSVVAVLAVAALAACGGPSAAAARHASTAPASEAVPPPAVAVPSRLPVPKLVRRPAARQPAELARDVTAKATVTQLAANGIPVVALNAYRVAAARVDNANSWCGIDWALLAGIGRVESDHGRFGGAVLNADGTSTPRTIGPALDGVHWSYVPAPANGLALDGDAKFAHALGPMQFIPTTWAAYGADADGDGQADVFNINDAALGTARYLCSAGGDLRTAPGQQRAVLAYNQSADYLAQVLALANYYRTGVMVVGSPVGNTNGALPAVGRTGPTPPANPGAPTALGSRGSTARTPAKPAVPRTSPAPRGAPAPSPSRPVPPAPPSATPPPPPTTGPTCNPLFAALGLCK